MPLPAAQKDLRKFSNKSKAKILQKFFKTGPGEYAEGDIFMGVTVPHTREVARRYQNLSLNETLTLLKSTIHEERLLALLILVSKYSNGDDKEKERIYKSYLKNAKHINNWDLVDLSADKIVGSYLMDKEKTCLYRLAKSRNLWKRRISILATFHFIKNNRYQETLAIAEALLSDPEDLIHKAVGWMLREIGKRDLLVEERFLKKCYKKMPRTMLRYAIERFPELKRKAYLYGRI